MSARILLPVRAHIKKYLEHTCGPHMEVSNRGYASVLLYLMLEKHKKSDPATIKPSQKMIDDVNYFGYEIYVGDSFEKKRGLFITPENIVKFNDSVDDLIRKEMYRYVKHPNATDQFVDYNIVRFQEFYGISEDELPFDNLKRWYYRERERLNQRKNFEKPFVPQLNLSF